MEVHPLLFIDILQALPRNARSSILNKPIQEPSTATLNTLNKSFRNSIRASRTRMRVIHWEESIHLRLTQRLEDIRRVRSMIHIHGIAPQRLRHIPRITHESPTIRIRETAALPRIIRRLAAHNNLSALGNKLLARLGEVVRKCVNCNSLAIIRRLARL